MNRDCEIIRDRVAALIAGELPADEKRQVQQHLDLCSDCRAYAGALEEQERMLTDFFAAIDCNMDSRQVGVIEALGRIEALEKGSFLSPWNVMESVLARHGLAAAVMVVVVIYFVITLTWISQINECIRLSM